MRNFMRLAAMAAMVCVMTGCTFEGEQGELGQAGEDGTDGRNGADGRNGVDGVNGEDGTDGVDGAPGPVGPAGPAGSQGEPGTPGEPGAPGAPGQDGEDGTDGVDGMPGSDGADGAPGEQGEPGTPGEPGAPGAPGVPGQDGEDGTDGADGAPGEPGTPGEPGEDGTDGADGAQGPAGEPAEGEGEGEEPECPDGSEGCACYGNGTCNDNLECDDNVCVEPEEPECPEGSAWCPCYGNNTCDDDLSCDQFEHICVPQCTQLGCSCDLDDRNGCDDGLLCSRAPWAGGMYFCDGDADGDGVSDMRDNCPEDADATQKDFEGDGIGDVCDNDDEGDGVPDAVDNCPSVFDRDNRCACEPGEWRVCYTGPAPTRGIGQCRSGSQTCVSDANGVIMWEGLCRNEVVPRAEVCGNFLDEDCNGASDDVGCAPPPPPPECNPGATRVCGNPAVGQCRQGQQTCGADSRWAACTGEVRPVVEACNALDDDCDNAVDEGLNCAPPPNGGTDQIRECAPADPVGNWGLSIMGVPNAVIEQATAAGQCVQMDTLTASRSNIRFNARRPNAGLYCCGTIAGSNVPQDLCPGLQVFRDGVQLVHGSATGQLQCQNDANGNNYRIVP